WELRLLVRRLAAGPHQVQSQQSHARGQAHDGILVQTGIKLAIPFYRPLSRTGNARKVGLQRLQSTIPAKPVFVKRRSGPHPVPLSALHAKNAPGAQLALLTRHLSPATPLAVNGQLTYRFLREPLPCPLGWVLDEFVKLFYRDRRRPEWNVGRRNG